jgi:hypothetical protein
MLQLQKYESHDQHSHDVAMDGQCGELGGVMLMT